MRVDESNFGILQDAYDITGIDDKIYWRDAENIDGYIDTDYIIDLMEELISKYEKLREEKIDLEEDLRTNYKPIGPYEMYGISENDFI